MTDHACGHIHPRHLSGPRDERGCNLQEGHDGPHRFIDTWGRSILWHYDTDCQCEFCISPDQGDECTVYWEEPHPAA